MAIRSVDEYKTGLNDGRTLFFKGNRVEDVTRHPDLGVGVKHASLDFALAEDAAYQDLMTAKIPDTDETISRYFVSPTSTDDLLKRREMIETSTRLGGGVVLLIKEIGTDALFALSLVAKRIDEQYGTDYLKRVRAYHQHCQRKDLSMAVAQTDVKGDRSLAPSEQTHPDYYVRVVEEREDGIVVRGCESAYHLRSLRGRNRCTANTESDRGR